ncbi:MAG: hypothetical protein HC812_09945 [Leptolyngbya sp. RL_3_1]|nr:hypothetical protein [Leptolyngbya sp. RL_3_1]
MLVFDQFEEFFFEENTLAERRQFYTFLQYCIDQPWVKVVLALREDYLHHLLEVERIVNQISTMGDLDLLSRQVRYPPRQLLPYRRRSGDPSPHRRRPIPLRRGISAAAGGGFGCPNRRCAPD